MSGRKKTTPAKPKLNGIAADVWRNTGHGAEHISDRDFHEAYESLNYDQLPVKPETITEISPFLRAIQTKGYNLTEDEMAAVIPDYVPVQIRRQQEIERVQREESGMIAVSRDTMLAQEDEDVIEQFKKVKEQQAHDPGRIKLDSLEPGFAHSEVNTTDRLPHIDWSTLTLEELLGCQFSFMFCEDKKAEDKMVVFRLTSSLNQFMTVPEIQHLLAQNGFTPTIYVPTFSRGKNANLELLLAYSQGERLFLVLVMIGAPAAQKKRFANFFVVSPAPPLPES